MIIDFHTHIFPEKIAGRTLDYLKEICQTEPYTDGTAKDLIRSQKEAGVDISVALPAVTKRPRLTRLTVSLWISRKGRFCPLEGSTPHVRTTKRS